jgi:hypothetical protein
MGPLVADNSVDPLITQISLIMDVRNLTVARACGKWPQD